MASRADIARKHYEWYREIYNDTQTWRESRDRCKKAYFGDQWESDVADRVRARGQVDVVINIIRTLIRNRASTMIASKPQGKIYGVNKQDIKRGLVLQDFCDYLWYNSHGQLRAERVVMSQNREGVGYFLVHLDPKADYGRGELKITNEIWRHVWIPKYASEWDYSDAPYIIVTKLKEESQFYQENPGYRGKLGPEYFQQDDEIRWSGQKEHEEKTEIDLPEGMQDKKFIRELDTYERFYRDSRILYYVPTGTASILDDDYTLSDQENDLLKSGVVKELVSPIPRIKYTKTFGEKVLRPINGRNYDILPIEDYPIVPVVDEDTNNAMPLGEIDHTFGVQELINKFFSTIVLNAALSSNPRNIIDAARAGVTDMKEFSEDMSIPGVWKDLKIDPASGKFPIDTLKPEPLNPAFYPLFERLIQQVQFGMATFSSKLGDTSNSPDTYAATLQYGEWQQDNLRIPLNRLEMGIQRVYDILLQWAPYHYTFPKPYPYIDDFQAEKMKNINFDDLTDITKIRAKFRIRIGSTLPAQSVAYMNFYKELAQTHPQFLKYLVEYLPVKEKDELSKELDMIPQLQEALEAKTQEGNTMAGMLQNTLRQLSEMEVRDDAAKTKLKLDELISKQKIKLDEIASVQRMQGKQIAASNKAENKKKSDK